MANEEMIGTGEMVIEGRRLREDPSNIALLDVYTHEQYSGGIPSVIMYFVNWKGICK